MVAEIFLHKRSVVIVAVSVAEKPKDLVKCVSGAIYDVVFFRVDHTSSLCQLQNCGAIIGPICEKRTARLRKVK